jgi:poly(hydroxyalkanoate) depolymerase family esterase
MAKRLPALLWNTGLQRKWLKWGRGMVRAAAKKSGLPARSLQTGRPGQPMTTGLVSTRRYYFFDPTEPSKDGLRPLLVMLHGCQQGAQEFSASTRMNRLAAEQGFMVLYPAQDRLAHGQGCWNWYGKNSGQSAREAASILATVDHVCTRYSVDTSKIAIAGFSAGASMAALVALHDPARFAAVAMHSGVDPRLANSTATALSAMRGRPRSGVSPVVALPRNLPPLLVLQGSTDHIVVKANGMRAATAWVAYRDAQAGTPRIVRRGKRYPLTTMDWTTRGRLVATLSEISGLAHAWSGGAASQGFSDPQGPDASRMVWAFAQRQFAIAVQAVAGGLRSAA